METFASVNITLYSTIVNCLLVLAVNVTVQLLYYTNILLPERMSVLFGN